MDQPQSFENYFSDLFIIREIIKTRVKLAKKRHDNHFIDRIVSQDIINRKDLIELNKILPPRNQWLRIAKPKRKESNSNDINRKSLLFTVNFFRSLPLKDQPNWVFNLNKFISDVRFQSLYSKKIKLTSPRIIPISKNKKSAGLELFRPLSVIEDFKSRIIINLTARYLMDSFDIVFKKSSYAFRRGILTNGLIPTHHDCINEIFTFKNEMESENIYVSECDIKSFYDIINHREILNSFQILKSELLEKHKIRIFGRAEDILKYYLKFYSAHYCLKKSKEYFSKNGIKGIVQIPTDELRDSFYSSEKNFLKHIGVPQGGSLSIFIANLVLHENDVLMEEIEKENSNFKYLRYCDDMIILSTNSEVSNKSYESYIEQLKNKKLLHHPEKRLLPYDTSENKKYFWSSKSKKSYHWSLFEYPWISFVGYQIRFDNFIRIRPSSIKNELNKQNKLINKIEYLVRNSQSNPKKFKLKKEKNSILERVKSRIISMSVGRISLKKQIYNINYSWIGGFKGLLNKEKILRNNIKELDRNRNKKLKWLKSQLDKYLPNSKKKSEILREEVYSFLGKPFSYFHHAKKK